MVDPVPFESLVTGGVPSELDIGFIAPLGGVPMHLGTVSPMVAQTFVLDGAGGLAVPVGSGRGPLDYMAVYMVLSDYLPELPGVKADPKRFLDLYMKSVSVTEAAALLALLNHATRRPNEEAEAVEGFRSMLNEGPRVRFDNAMRGRSPHRPLARQPILGALRAVLADLGRPVEHSIPGPGAAILMSHAVAETYETGMVEGETIIGGIRSGLTLDLVANFSFYEGDDAWSVIDRQVLLWRDLEDLARPFLDGLVPADVVREATGLEVEDFLAMGFAVYGHALNWTAPNPYLLNEVIAPGVTEVQREAFLKLISATPAEMEALLASQTSSRWDFLAFQQRPVLRLPAGLLVLDEDYLVQRVTAGLYWTVHDHMKATKGELARQRWTQAWGAVVEAAAEEMLKPHSPVPLGGDRPLYWDEHDLDSAYGKGGVDAVIDFGVGIGLFEVVSGQLTIGTRVALTETSFKSDMEKLVMKKARQLHATAMALIGDEHPLTEVTVGKPRPIIPVVVVASGLPMIPPVLNYIDGALEEESLLRHACIRPLCILDLRELEILEALNEQGRSMWDLLSQWKRSGLARVSFLNWVLAQPWYTHSRPSRMADRSDRIFRLIQRRLFPGEEDIDPDSPPAVT